MFNHRLMFIFALSATVLAENDWSKPCTSGTCSYETGDGVKTAWASISVVSQPYYLSRRTS